MESGNLPDWLTNLSFNAGGGGLCFEGDQFFIRVTILLFTADDLGNTRARPVVEGLITDVNGRSLAAALKTLPASFFNIEMVDDRGTVRVEVPNG